MIAFKGWTLGGSPVSLPMIVNTSLYESAVAGHGNFQYVINTSKLYSTFDDAYNYMFTTLIKDFGSACAARNLPTQFSMPAIANGHTSTVTGIGMVVPELISGSGSVTAVAPTGNNGPTLSTSWATNYVSTTTSQSGVKVPYMNASVRGEAARKADTIELQLLPETAFTDSTYNGATIYYAHIIFELSIQPSGNMYRAKAMVQYFSDTTVNLTSSVTSTIGGIKGVEDTDPYSQGDESGSISPAGSTFTGIGGNGTYTSPGYSGGVPALPTLSAVDTGLLRLYCSSSAAGMNGLASYLWSSAFDLDTFKKLFADPMELIFGAAILPCTPPSTASVITFGNINTGVSMPQATAQYLSVDCGTMNIPLYYGTFLDYAPHTKISIYLPYIGMRELNATEIVGKTLGVVYHVDVLTGACVAFVTVNGVVMYEYSGSCAVQIPITSNNWASVLQSLATIGGTAIGGFAAGGPVGSVVAAGAAAASNAASGGLTPSFQRGGSVSGSAGLLADQNPYIVMEIPNMCKASGQNWFEGYPNYTTQLLSQCSGYTKVQSVHLEGIGCTAAELTEIETLLKGGVVI